MSDTPLHIEGTIEWLQNVINSGPDFAGRTLLRTYNRRFAASSQELPVAALPALLPGQVNISGNYGGGTFHEFASRGGYRFAFAIAPIDLTDTDWQSARIFSPAGEVFPEKMYPYYTDATEVGEWPEWDSDTTNPADDPAPTTSVVSYKTFTLTNVGTQQQNWIFWDPNCGYYMGTTTESDPYAYTNTTLTGSIIDDFPFPELADSIGYEGFVSKANQSSASGVLESGDEYSSNAYSCNAYKITSSEVLGNIDKHLGILNSIFDETGGANADLTLGDLLVQGSYYPKHPGPSVEQMAEHFPPTSVVGVDLRGAYKSIAENEPYNERVYTDEDTGKKVYVAFLVDSIYGSVAPGGGATTNYKELQAFKISITYWDVEGNKHVLVKELGTFSAQRINDVYTSVGNYIEIYDIRIFKEAEEFGCDPTVTITTVTLDADWRRQDVVFHGWSFGDDEIKEYSAPFDINSDAWLAANGSDGLPHDYESYFYLMLSKDGTYKRTE